MDPSIIKRVLDIAIEIAQIPAPTFEEHHRAEFMRRNFSDQGVKEVILDKKGNVYAHIKGLGEKPPLVISAHLDTVFPSGTDLSITRTDERISGSGIGDNSLGLAGLFGVFWAFCGSNYGRGSKQDLPGDLWLVANVGEEGLGNLLGMKEVVNRFKGDVLGYIVLEGMSLGQIYHRGLGVRRYLIKVQTKGGHSWVDYGNPSAINELTELMVKIKNLEYPAEPRTTYNMGVISGGTSINTIAAKASLQLDLRSVSPEVLGKVSGEVEELVNLANQKGGQDIHVSAEVIGERPAGEIPANHILVLLAKKCYAASGMRVRLNIGSTDANEPLSRGYPAICVGLTTGGCSHTTAEYIDAKPIGQGLEILVNLVQTVFRDINTTHNI